MGDLLPGDCGVRTRTQCGGNRTDARIGGCVGLCKLVADIRWEEIFMSIAVIERWT